MSLDAGTLASSLYGQGSNVVGRMITSPWFAGSHRINQGWGPSGLSLEPEGHGYAHWHAGVDVDMDTGTELHAPDAIFGTVRWVDNPAGYGTALRLELNQAIPSRGGAVAGGPRTFDVWLGHLSQRFMSDGEQFGPGDLLASSDTTGNSTGPHLHFEVRPPGGKYGTDIDPTQLLLGGGPAVNLPNPFDVLGQLQSIEGDVSGGITSAEHLMLGLGQAALGSVLMIGGLAVVAYGVRGKDLGAMRSDAARLATRPSQAREEEPAPEPEEEEEPEARTTRVRVTHQRELRRGASQRQTAGTDLSSEAEEAVHRARSGRGRRLSPEVTRELRARDTRLRHPRRGSFKLRAS